MLVVQINHIYTQSQQAAITCLFYIFRTAADTQESPILSAHNGEFGSQHYLIPVAPQDLADQFFIFPHTVGVGSIPKVDPQL
ncbi:hypothetical protein D3C74_489220 [compost metagenome]